MEIGDGRYKYIAILAMTKKNPLVAKLLGTIEVDRKSIEVNKIKTVVMVDEVQKLKKITQQLIYNYKLFNKSILDYMKKRGVTPNTQVDSNKYMMEAIASEVEVKMIYDKIIELKDMIFDDEIEELILSLFHFEYGIPLVDEEYKDSVYKSTFSTGFIEQMSDVLAKMSNNFEVDYTDKEEDKIMTIQEIIDLQNSLYIVERNGQVGEDENIFRFKDIPFKKDDSHFNTRVEMKISFERNPKSMVMDFEELASIKEFVEQNYSELLNAFEEGTEKVTREHNGDSYHLYLEKGDGGSMSIYLNTGANRIYF